MHKGLHQADTECKRGAPHLEAQGGLRGGGVKALSKIQDFNA